MFSSIKNKKTLNDKDFVSKIKSLVDFKPFKDYTDSDIIKCIRRGCPCKDYVFNLKNGIVHNNAQCELNYYGQFNTTAKKDYKYVDYSSNVSYKTIMKGGEKTFYDDSIVFDYMSLGKKERMYVDDNFKYFGVECTVVSIISYGNYLKFGKLHKSPKKGRILAVMI